MKRLFYLLALLIVARALKLQARARKIPVLKPANNQGDDTSYVFWTAPNLILPESVKFSAIARAREEGLDVLDLWPADLSSSVLVSMLSAVDPEAYDRHPLLAGKTAGQAMLIRREIAERSGVEPPSNPQAFDEAAIQLRRHSKRFGFALAEGLRAVPEEPRWRLAHLRENLPLVAKALVLMRMLLVMVPALGIFWSLPAGLTALVSYHIEPVLARSRTRFHPRDLAMTVLLRTGKELYAWAACLLRPLTARPEKVSRQQASYQELLRDGTGKFFEARSPVCPICSGTNLKEHLRSHDVAQKKPGLFFLERCMDCGHIFQNPRLSLEGLSFYYKDFYDYSFGDEGKSPRQERTFARRALRVQGLIEPKHWLDVGGGRGDFCRIGQEVWPGTSFDVLDQAEGVDRAERQGWVEHAFDQSFKDIAPRLEGHYDVVSMSHYLEHTRDPRAELIAAHTVLKPGGFLSIEVPNPANPLARLLGRYWLGWFQPQHMHFINEKNFNRLFSETGFEPIRWYWKEAHKNANFSLAVLLLLMHYAPYPELPWRERSGPTAYIRFFATWALAPVLIPFAFLLDVSLSLVLARRPWSFDYGVLARRL